MNVGNVNMIVRVEADPVMLECLREERRYERRRLYFALLILIYCYLFPLAFLLLRQ